jgi:hypothetical protein
MWYLEKCLEDEEVNPELTHCLTAVISFVENILGQLASLPSALDVDTQRIWNRYSGNIKGSILIGNSLS